MRHPLASIVRAHPVLWTFLLSCLGAGVFAAFYFLPPEWSSLRRSAAGLIGGAGVWLLITAPRLLAEGD